MRSFDVVILGSGFAGSLLGRLLRIQGLSVLVVDRARHPRFAIGESSTPAADFLLESICDRYQLDDLRSLCRYGSWCRERPQVSRGLKRGFSYFHHQPHQLFTPGQNHENELLVAASASDEVGDTHWYRADVDQYLANRYVESGGELWEQSQVEEIDPGPPWSLNIAREGHVERVIAEFVVDGTGGDSALVRYLQLSNQCDTLLTHSRSLFGHFRDVSLWSDLLDEWGIDRSEYPYPCDQAALHHLIEGGWMWVLRFDNEVTSIGWSMDPRLHPETGLPPFDEWSRLLEPYPSIKRHLATGRPAAPFTDDSPLIRTRRLQRLVAPAAGETWALLPHTAGFIDPFYSTGIAHSLLGIERLAEILVRHPGERTEGLSGYSRTITRELRLIDQLVSLAFRSMGRPPELLHAASMLYFAAATTFESRRRLGTSGEFLLADCPDFLAVVKRLTAAFPRDPGVREAAQHWAIDVQSQLTPWNTVGLFRPQHPNMYWHTAAEKGH